MPETKPVFKEIPVPEYLPLKKLIQRDPTPRIIKVVLHKDPTKPFEIFDAETGKLMAESQALQIAMSIDDVLYGHLVWIDFEAVPENPDEVVVEHTELVNIAEINTVE